MAKQANTTKDLDASMNDETLKIPLVCLRWEPQSVDRERIQHPPKNEFKYIICLYWTLDLSSASALPCTGLTLRMMACRCWKIGVPLLRACYFLGSSSTASPWIALLPQDNTTWNIVSINPESIGVEFIWDQDSSQISLFPEGTCDFQSVDQIKGWTRASVIALILISASELDHADPATKDLLAPLEKVLDKCWCIPCHALWLKDLAQNWFLFSNRFQKMEQWFNGSYYPMFWYSMDPCWLTKMEFGMSATSKSFRNLVVSYRGAERQPPNCLQLALRFSRLMEVAEQEGRHQASMSTEERLRAIIAEFHESPGLANKNFIDEDKRRSILNIVSGSCPDPGTLICWDLEKKVIWHKKQFHY